MKSPGCSSFRGGGFKMGTQIHWILWRRSQQGHSVSHWFLELNFLLKCLISWGESAGAISISIMMLMNKGNPNGFFRGAFMESGAPIPVGDITHGQRYYDAIVREVGCQRSFNSLNCLRQVDYEHIRAAMLASPALLSYQVSGELCLRMLYSNRTL